MCLPSSFPPMSLHLCSSTHPLTSRANSTCLTRLSAPWCKREGGDVLLPEERGNEGAEGRGKGRTCLLVPFAAETEALPADGAFEERLLAGETWLKKKKKKRQKEENTELAPFFQSQDYLALDVCRVPEHAQKKPIRLTYTIFSFCMLIAELI